MVLSVIRLRKSIRGRKDTDPEPLSNQGMLCEIPRFLKRVPVHIRICNLRRNNFFYVFLYSFIRHVNRKLFDFSDVA